MCILEGDMMYNFRIKEHKNIVSLCEYITQYSIIKNASIVLKLLFFSVVTTVLHQSLESLISALFIYKKNGWRIVQSALMKEEKPESHLICHYSKYKSGQLSRKILYPHNTPVCFHFRESQLILALGLKSPKCEEFSVSFNKL